MAEYQSGRYDVVRYPNCYAVVDKQDPNHRHVKQFPFSVGGRESAHRLCNTLNRDARAAREAAEGSDA